jgi:hypothetical protein
MFRIYDHFIIDNDRYCCISYIEHILNVIRESCVSNMYICSLIVVNSFFVLYLMCWFGNNPLYMDFRPIQILFQVPFNALYAHAWRFLVSHSVCMYCCYFRVVIHFSICNRTEFVLVWNPYTKKYKLLIFWTHTERGAIDISQEPFGLSMIVIALTLNIY